jgi:DUF1680 family protein
MRRTLLILAWAAMTAAAGDLTSRYQLTLKRVLTGGPPVYSDDFVLKDAIPEHVRRFTEYSGDVSGRYIGALAVAATDLGTPVPQLDRVVSKVLGLQKQDGYWGDPFHWTKPEPNDMALVWGNGRLLIGLLEYYRYKPKPEVLTSARRAAEFLLRIAPVMNADETRSAFEKGQFASGYICWTQNIEAFAELYRLTRDPRYRDMAEQIATRTGRGPASHAHGFLTSLRGIAELYKVTGERKFLDQAEREWQAIIDSDNMFLPGTIPEAWRPNAIRTEGCAEADWVRLSLTLWQITGNRKYLETTERIVFNELAMNQFDTGDFGHRTLSADGVAGSNAARAWWCCTLHGLRCFPELLAGAFRTKSGTVFYDLPVDGRVRAEGLTVLADSSLARDASVSLRVTSAAGGKHALSIRVPQWARSIAISLNGTKLQSALQDGYQTLNRRWKAGDRVVLRYAMTTRIVRNAKSGQIALFHGPWLLGVDEGANPYYFDEPSHENRLRLQIAADNTVKLERAPATAAGPFGVPAARFRITYLPGGYPVAPSTALLRPIAEQTSTRSTRWEYWLALEEAPAK